jgi:MFS family permease
MALGQAVMVGVMAVTSLHILDGDQPRYMISLVISFHIVGMYAFSPWVGRLVDRFGSELMIAVESTQLFIGAETASHTSAEDAPGVLVGLFLMGTGWSFCMVSGSAMLTASTPTECRVGVQATADFLMTLGGASAGITSGLVVENYGFHYLSHWAGFVAIGLAVISVWAVVQRLGSRDDTLAST